jgi:PAS domain S-box-containing protein
MTNLEQSNIYRLLFDSAAEGLVVTDRNGIINLTNPQLDTMFGYERNALIGCPVEDLIPGSMRTSHREVRENFAHQPQKRSMGSGRDLRGLKKNGNEFPIEVSLNHLDIDGELFFLGLVTDISPRKKVEHQIQELNRTLEEKVEQRTAALRESQELYSLVSRNFPKGSINVLDADFICVFAEGVDLEQHATDPASLIGKSYLDRIPIGQRAEVEEVLQRVQQGEVCNLDVERNPDAIYNLNAVPLKSATGFTSRILVVERDITEEKRYALEITRSLEKERELNELKSRFVSMASHEFRTPLSTILSSAALAGKYAESGDKEKLERHHERIKSSVNHLTNILNDFLSLSKLEEGMVQCRPEPTALDDFFHTLRSEMQEITRNGQQVRLSVNVPENVVNVDPFMLKNTCINLISNAIKYSPEDSIVDVRVTGSNRHISIEVQDYGIGIPEDEQKNLFSRFFRARNATNIQGTGLGLNIIARYIDLMGAEIQFRSKEGQGTTFMLFIPIR